jgi:hypothetical protein
LGWPVGYCLDTLPDSYTDFEFLFGSATVIVVAAFVMVVAAFVMVVAAFVMALALMGEGHLLTLVSY